MRSASGEPRLWRDTRGDLHDAIGPVRLYASGPPPADAGELAIFVAEWLICTVEREGQVAFGDIHPSLRALVYELVPSAICMSDEDAIGFVHRELLS